MSKKLEEIILTKAQKKQADALDPKDGSTFCALGQVTVGNVDPRAGSLFCYRLDRKQYNAIAKTISKTLGLKW